VVHTLAHTCLLGLRDGWCIGYHGVLAFVDLGAIHLHIHIVAFELILNFCATYFFAVEF
jgi:hypothetical protein